jgi:hypothetical protein
MIKKLLLLVAVVLAVGFLFSSRAHAGSVNVDLDNDCSDSNRNTGVIDNDADPVTIWITSNEKQFVGQYLISVSIGGTTYSTCAYFNNCGDPHQWYWAQVSFDSLLSSGEPTGKANVQVSESPEGCTAGGKVVGGQTITVTD